MESRGKTLFIDIDGTLFKHQKDGTGACFDPGNRIPYDPSNGTPGKILAGVLKAFNDWHSKGYRLIITTGRCESMREVTERQLRKAGLFWDMLIMGIGGGERILINDISPTENMPKAIGINLVRDSGFEKIDEIYDAAKKAAGAPTDKKYTI